MNGTIYSSKSYLWETPQHLFDKLNNEFKFTLDVCADEYNKKCEKFYSENDNALDKKWDGICWMNPPYGKNITRHWIKKAYEESLNGATVVCLVPSRTDTPWWHDYATKAKEIRFIRGRLKFGGSKQPAPFPSVILVFSDISCSKT